MPQTELKIEGMVCAACIGHVEKALRSVPGVRAAKADLAAGRAVIEHENAGTPASLDTLVAAVAEEGYTARPAA